MDRKNRMWLLNVALVLSASPTYAQEFRIETEIFVGSSKQPTSENLTIFSDNRVYDFMLSKPNAITVYDPLAKKFTLIDPTRRLRTEITCDKILEFVAKLKSTDRRDRDPFIFEPYFDVAYDSKNRHVTLRSNRIIYSVDGMKPSEPQVVFRYRRFADWYARLNSMIPGSMPPFARIEMNKEMAERYLIPERVELTINPRPRSSAKKIQARSKHLVTWELSKGDRTRIANALNYMQSDALSVVHFNVYHGIPKVASNRR